MKYNEIFQRNLLIFFAFFSKLTLGPNGTRFVIENNQKGCSIMKKFNVPRVSKKVKTIIAAAMAVTLAVPTTVYFSAKASVAQAEGAALPQSVATVDFERGFKGEEQKNGLNVVKSEQVLVFKELLDENGNYKYNGFDKIAEMTDIPVIQSDEYVYSSKGNQPTTAYDEEKGNVLVFSEDVTVPEFKKKEKDAEKNNYPVGTILQYETTVLCQAQMNNPFAGKDLSKGASVSYWVKVPASAEDSKKGANSTLVVFGVKDEDNRKVRTTADNKEKLAEQEKESKLSVQITSNNDFHYVNNGNSNAYDGEGTVLAEPNTWAYVTLSMMDDAYTIYVNGKLATSNELTVDGLMKALSDSNTGVFFGGNYSTAAEAVGQNFGTVKGVCMDDIAFYTQSVSEDEALELYKVAEASKRVKDNPVLLEKYSFDDGTMKSAEGNLITATNDSKAPTVIEDAQKGSVIKLEGGTSSKTAGAAFGKNPYAGMTDLEGATINFYVRVPETKRGVPATYALTFIDEPKLIEHPKLYETYKGSIESTVLYTMTDMTGFFQEGYTGLVGSNSLKNNYTFSITRNGNVVDEPGKLYDATAAACQKVYNETLESMSEWHMMTVVLKNSGIQLYLDGVKLNNNLAEPNGKPTYYAPRFYDGYYESIYDEFAKFYNGTDNQGATSIMEFITDPTTSIYLGYMYKQTYKDTFEKTYEAYYDDIAFWTTAFDDAQVEKLWLGEEPLPDGPPGPTFESNSDKDNKDDASSDEVTDSNKGESTDKSEIVSEGAVIVETTVTENEDGTVGAGGAGISIKADRNAFTELPSIKFTLYNKADRPDVYNAFNSVFDKVTDFVVKDMVIYELSVEDPSVLKGSYQLTLDIPEGFDTKALVVVDEDGMVYNGTVSKDGKTFTVENVKKFGKFALVVKDLSTDDESSVAKDNVYPDKTGDTANVAIPVMVLAAAGAVLVVASKKRRAEER